MKLISVVLIIVVMSSCFWGRRVEATFPMESINADMDMMEKTFEGIIITDSFVNKVGTKSEDWSDLYFETNDKKRHFLKFTDSTFTRTKALGLVDKPIKVEGFLREGHWDCDEDLAYEVQSRIGFYLVITKVLEE